MKDIKVYFKLDIVYLTSIIRVSVSNEHETRHLWGVSEHHSANENVLLASIISLKTQSAEPKYRR